jgi:hypothetical protein
MGDIQEYAESKRLRGSVTMQRSPALTGRLSPPSSNLASPPFALSTRPEVSYTTKARRLASKAASEVKNSSESEQPALFAPGGREAGGFAHQRFGIELLWLATVDNCRGDVGELSGILGDEAIRRRGFPAVG